MKKYFQLKHYLKSKYGINMAEMWEIEGFEFLKGTFHYEKSQPYRLWYEYLRLSTIYFQAHKERTSKGGLTEQEIKELPDDFDQVRKTYDAFGDIYKYPFRSWWAGWEGKARLFGHTRTRLKATTLAYVAHGHVTNRDACKKALDGYLDDYNEYHEGNLNYLLLAVPLNSSRADILRAVNEQIEDEYLQLLPAEYSLHGDRIHIETLTTTLRLLLMRAREPKSPLWKLGVKARVSEKYANFDINIEHVPYHLIDTVQIIENITSRTLRNALNIMDNAARGKFPCKDKIENSKPKSEPKLKEPKSKSEPKSETKPKAKLTPEQKKYRYMWQCMRRRREANERHSKFMMDYYANRSRNLSLSDWRDNIIAVQPEIAEKLEQIELEEKKKFIERQLEIHAPGEPKKRISVTII
jgi:hypothetical protein